MLKAEQLQAIMLLVLFQDMVQTDIISPVEMLQSIVLFGFQAATQMKAKILE